MTAREPGAALRNPHLEGGPFFWESGPVGVLMLHGLTATTAEVRPLARFLHSHGYTTAGPLLPGHGTTPQDLNRRKWSEWVGAAEDAYQYLAGACEKVYIAGASMGGLLALYLASQQPELRGLMLYAPALRVRHAQYAFLVSLFTPALRKRPGHEEMPWQGYFVNPTGAAAQLYRLQREVLKRLQFVTQPVVIFQGGQDQTIDPTSSRIAYDLIQSECKQLCWYEKASHVILLDQDGPEVERLTLEFIKMTEGD